MNQEQVREALMQWESLGANKENRIIYEARMKELRDQLSNLEGERRLGREEGRKEGKEEGIKLIVKKMLRMEKDILEISEITGLSIEEINKLKE